MKPASVGRPPIVNRFALVLTTLAIGFSGGCATWDVQHAAPMDVLRHDQPELIRLRVDSASGDSVLVLEHPCACTDSLFGSRQIANAPAGSRGSRVGVPLSSIRSLEVRSDGRTPGDVLGKAVMGLALAGLLVYASLASSYCL